MTAPRTTGRARRVALATAALGVAAVALAPASSASGYNDVAPPNQGTQVLGTKSGPPAKHHVVKHHAKKHHAASTLAYTGAEVGALGTTGVVLVAGGALLVRSGRRRQPSAA